MPSRLLRLTVFELFQVYVFGAPQKKADRFSHNFPLPSAAIAIAVSAPVQYGCDGLPPRGQPRLTLLPLIPTTQSGASFGTRHVDAEPHVRIGLVPVSFVTGIIGGAGGGVIPLMLYGYATLNGWGVGLNSTRSPTANPTGSADAVKFSEFATDGVTHAPALPEQNGVG